MVLSLATLPVCVFSEETSILNTLNDSELMDVRSGEIVVKEIPTAQAAGVTYEVTGEVKTSMDVLLDVLVDYAAYGEFMPAVSRVDIVEQSGDMAVLNFILELPMDLSRRHRIQIELSQPDAKTARLEWYLVEWPGLKPSQTIRDTRGYWLIQEQAQNRLLVLYHVYSDPGEIPFGLGWLVEPMTKSSIPEAFTETRDRAEKLFSNP